MPADRIHLIRHGEVYNPEGILYGRLPHFRLSDFGHQMAEAAALDLKNQKRRVSRIVSSPLLRARESAEHIQNVFKAEIEIDERLIEPHNIFEGYRMTPRTVAIRSNLFFHMRNPFKPSWGEPFAEIAHRVLAAMREAASQTSDGDVVIVSHQAVIVMAQRAIAGKRLYHDPRKRRCSLSSITSFEVRGQEFIEVDYREPALSLEQQAIDKGAV